MKRNLLKEIQPLTPALSPSEGAREKNGNFNVRGFLAILSLLAATGAFMTGCASDSGAYVPTHTMINDVENHEMVVLLDKRVQNSITCDGIQQTTTPDGRMQITANFRNKENRRLQVQVSCVFKDDLNFPTEGEDAPFRNLILRENAQEPMQFVAMNNHARKFTIRVSEAH